MSGKMARGINSQIIELIVIGESVDKVFLLKLVQRLESIIKKKISFVVFSATGFKSFEVKNKDERLLIWNMICGNINNINLLKRSPISQREIGLFYL